MKNLIMVTTFLINALHTAVTETTRQRFRNCGSHVKYAAEELILTLSLTISILLKS